MITGYLTPESPLRKIFPTGTVPLVDAIRRTAFLGDSSTAEPVYMLALFATTRPEKEKLIAAMVEARQGEEAEARQVVDNQPELPLRATHFSAVGMSLRAFI